MSIILTTNEIEQIKQNKCIGKGSFANLYEYDDKVIKLFKGRLDGEEKRLIKALQKENIENFIFPEEIVRDFFRFMIGYTEEKINGITLRKLFQRCLFLVL